VKDFGQMMKQAQGLQQKLQDAQARLAETTVEGQSGAGLVKLTLKGSGELVVVNIDEGLLAPGEAEMVSDLLVAAHADAKKKLDEAQQRLMQDALGPLAGMAGGLGGMPGLPPGFKF
jgi:nucleoid-associated protein EbfC